MFQATPPAPMAGAVRTRASVTYSCTPFDVSWLTRLRRAHHRLVQFLNCNDSANHHDSEWCNRTWCDPAIVDAPRHCQPSHALRLALQAVVLLCTAAVLSLPAGLIFAATALSAAVRRAHAMRLHVDFNSACVQVDSSSAQAATLLLTRLSFAAMRRHLWAVVHMCV